MDSSPYIETIRPTIDTFDKNMFAIAAKDQGSVVNICFNNGYLVLSLYSTICNEMKDKNNKGKYNVYIAYAATPLPMTSTRIGNVVTMFDTANEAITTIDTICTNIDLLIKDIILVETIAELNSLLAYYITDMFRDDDY